MQDFERFMVTAGGIGATLSSVWGRNLVTTLKPKHQENLRIIVFRNWTEEIKITLKLVLRSESYN